MYWLQVKNSLMCGDKNNHRDNWGYLFQGIAQILAYEQASLKKVSSFVQRIVTANCNWCYRLSHFDLQFLISFVVHICWFTHQICKTDETSFSWVSHQARVWSNFYKGIGHQCHFLFVLLIVYFPGISICPKYLQKILCCCRADFTLQVILTSFYFD